MRALIIAAALLAVAIVVRAQSPETVAARGEAAFRSNGCYGCHMVGKFGTAIGPDLSRVGRKYSTDFMARWLRDPAMQRPSAHMPALELSEADVQALAGYLGSLR
jgi:cbb3-type cytochrome oxidase cytochrome c subunit